MKFNYGNRWTMDKLTDLMRMWDSGKELDTIASELNSTPNAIRKVIQRLRKNGVPLIRRTKGRVSGRSSKYWSQGEVEYLVRRRKENATNEEISVELGRSECAIAGMVSNLRINDVPIPLKGYGMRRLYNTDSLKAISLIERGQTTE